MMVKPFAQESLYLFARLFNVVLMISWMSSYRLFSRDAEVTLHDT